MIIDAHSHGLNGKDLDRITRAGGSWAKNTLSFLMGLANEKPHFTDVGLRLAMLDRTGIQYQVVTPPHHLDCNNLPGGGASQLKLAGAINDNMAGLMELSKGRLLAAASIPLAVCQNGGLEELERAVKTLGLVAVSIPTNVSGRPPDLPEFDSFWAKATELNIPVYIHPNDPAGVEDRSYENEYDLIHNFGWPFETVLILSRLVFSGIMERFPELKVVGHHLGGGMIPFYFGRIEETYAPDYQQKRIGRKLSRPLYDYFSRFYFDTAVGGSAPAIRCVAEVFGVEQLLFATDAPWGPGTGEERLIKYPEVIKALEFSETDNQKIFCNNARRLLNFKRSPYL